MSINIEECVKIHQAVVANNVILAVCHVLRYTNYTKAIRRILDSNVLGDIVNIQHLEPVGFWVRISNFGLDCVNVYFIPWCQFQ